MILLRLPVKIKKDWSDSCKSFKSSPFIFLLLLVPSIMFGQTQKQADEWIKVYFNMPSDHSVSFKNNQSNDDWDLTKTLTSLIDSADCSVDLAIYDLENPEVGQALIRASQRGVRVRIVTDDFHRNDAPEIDSAMWASLRKAAIISIDDDGDIYMPDGSVINQNLSGSSYDMHNKFAVIDEQTIWTGSYNLTTTSPYNTNNVVVIKDDAIATAYIHEFEEMWGSSTAKPNAVKAAFHDEKDEIEQHVFAVNGTKVELYFAPRNDDETDAKINKRLVHVVDQQAQHDVSFMTFVFSPTIPLSRKVWGMSATGEISLTGIIDETFYARYENKNAIWTSIGAHTTNRTILSGRELRKLHDKVMIIDAASPDTTDMGVVITGSYNFSKTAEHSNDENLLIIYSDIIANQYYQDFKGILSRAEGKTYASAPPVSTERWYEVSEISDGSLFRIEIVPGFDYGIRLLGVEVPSFYAKNDSADWFSPATDEFLHHLLDDAKVRLSGPYHSKPDVRYGMFQAYVTVKKNGKIFSLNKRMLLKGMGTYVPYYPQHPDSVKAYKTYSQTAETYQRGMWKHPEKIGTFISRVKAKGETSKTLTDVFPININTADMALLELLPGVGPATAKKIINYRQQNGPFKNVGELIKIKGIGDATMKKLRPNVTVNK